MYRTSPWVVLSGMTTPKLLSLSDIGLSYYLDALNRQEALADGRILGPSTGLKGLDEALGGYLTPGVHVLTGSPGVGKTAFGFQIATDCGAPSVYLTVETTPYDLLERHMARKGSPPLLLSSLRSGAVAPAQLVDEINGVINPAPQIVIVDARAATADEAIVQRIVEKQGIDKVSTLLVVDSLQLWSRSLGSFNRPLSEYELINEGMKVLSRLAAEKPVAILAISHRNRAGQERGGMFAGKGSGDIEYTAETLLELQQQPDAKPDARGEVAVDLRLVKNRRGPAGQVFKLKFKGEKQSFRLEEERGKRGRR